MRTRDLCTAASARYAKEDYYHLLSIQYWSLRRGRSYTSIALCTIMQCSHVTKFVTFEKHEIV